LDADSISRWRALTKHRRTTTAGSSLTFFVSKESGFPASKVTADISLDGQRVNLRWAIRERIGGLVEEASDAVQVRLDQDGRLYFQRKNETLTLQDLSSLIVSLADRFWRVMGAKLCVRVNP
jgi:hypothetical protein